MITELKILGETASLGCGDPSAIGDVLAYSAVSTDRVETCIAEAGIKLGVAIPAIDVPDGVLISEVPSLNISEFGYELYAHRYIMRADGSRILPGEIVWTTAEDSDGPWPEPQSLEVHHELPGVGVWTEPAALDGYVALSRVDATGTVERIALFAHAGTVLSYVGTLLTRTDAQLAGVIAFDAPALVRSSRTYLLVSPRTTTYEHEGVWIFEVRDLPSAKLRRTWLGRPKVIAKIPPVVGPTNQRGGGQATVYDGEVLFAQVMQESRPHWRLWQSGVRI